MDEDCFLALFLGERATTIPESAKERLWGTDWSNLHKVQIAKEHLTPLCSSLERLDFEDLGDEERNFFNKDGTRRENIVRPYTSRAISSTAFILRHLPKLRIIDQELADYQDGLLYKAIRLLSPGSKLVPEKSEEVEELFQTNGELSNTASSSSHDVKWTFNAPFSGI